MSTLGGTCRNIKAPVVTLTTGREQKFYRDIDILCHAKKLKSNTGRLLLQISLCCDIMKNRRQNLRRNIISRLDTDYCNLESLLRHYKKKSCHDKVMSVTTLKDKVSGPDRETKSRQVMLT